MKLQFIVIPKIVVNVTEVAEVIEVVEEEQENYEPVEIESANITEKAKLFIRFS